MSASDTRQGPGSPGRIRLLDRKAVAWITLVVTLLASLALARYFDAQIERRSAERFRLNAEIEQGVLASRLKAYELALRGVAGLFAGSAQVDRAEWEAYANILAVPRFVPGLQAIGHARVFPAHVRAALEARIRAEGFADFRVHPPSDAALQSSVVFISPQNAGNALAFGYDMLTEPTRKAAMEASARSGAVTLAGPLSLIQNGAPKPRTGFVLYLATHAQPAPGEATHPPPAMPAGFAFASFYIADVMLPLLGDGARALDITLYDGSIGENRLLFSTATGQHAPAHTLDLPIDFGGQHWIARFSSSTEFEAAHASSRPATVLAGGVIVGLLLFSMLFINARHRGRLASVATRLAQSREEFRTLVENVPGVVFRCETHPPWRVSHISKRITELTGEDAEQFIHGACHFATFMHDDDIAPVAEQIEQAMAERRPYVVEYRMIDRKGRQRWVSEHGQAHFDADGQPLWLDGVLLDVTEHRAAEDAIRNLAFVDTLTQLPNRRFLLDRLRQGLANSRRHGRHGALLFIDLDHFKAVNDTHGHDAGDQLLCEVATRLRQSVREGDTVARLGGDEFVVMLEDLGDSGTEACEKAALIAENVLVELNRPFMLDDTPYHNTPSIGISCFSGADQRAEDLLRRADEAMYRAKAEGRNRFATADQRTRAQT